MQVSIETVTFTSASGVMVRLVRDAAKALSSEAAALLAWERRTAVAGQYAEAIPGAEADLERAQGEAAVAAAAVTAAEDALESEQSQLRKLKTEHRDLPRVGGSMLRGGTFDPSTGKFTDAPLAPGVRESQVAVRVAQRRVEEQLPPIEAARLGLRQARDKSGYAARRVAKAKERLTALRHVSVDLREWPRPESPSLLALLGLLQEGRDD